MLNIASIHIYTQNNLLFCKVGQTKSFTAASAHIYSTRKSRPMSSRKLYAPHIYFPIKIFSALSPFTNIVLKNKNVQKKHSKRIISDAKAPYARSLCVFIKKKTL